MLRGREAHTPLILCATARGSNPGPRGRTEHPFGYIYDMSLHLRNADGLSSLGEWHSTMVPRYVEAAASVECQCAGTNSKEWRRAVAVWVFTCATCFQAASAGLCSPT